MPAMQQRVAHLLGVQVGQVGLKAKTTEGLGAIGAGDAIAALAVAMVTSRRAVRQPRR
jgi:2C-methyl-D-erythritol 2,4-cyclodiphosphate synthase